MAQMLEKTATDGMTQGLFVKQDIVREMKKTEDPPLATGGIPTSLRFEETLSEKSRDRSLPKRERTRYLIFTIVARCMQEDPRKNPTVEFVLEQSGLARGTFYNHFKDVDDCILEMLVLFLAYIESSRVSNARALSSYEAILEANTWYCRAYEKNANLFAVVSHNVELLKERATRNAEWTKKITHVSERRRGRTFTSKERTEFEGVTRILITMTIETLRDRYVNKDPLLTKSFPTADSIAATLSDLWHQTLSRYEKG